MVVPKNPRDKNMTPVIQFMKVKYKDIFDMGQFYEALKEWMQEHDWTAFDGGLEEWETFFGEKIGQGGGKELWIWWRLLKKAPETEAFAYHLRINFHIIGLSPTEIIKGGQKIKAEKGEVEMEFEAYLEEKYRTKFESEKGLFGFILKETKEMFTKRIYTNIIDQRKKELYQEVYALNTFIKQWFKMKRYLPYEEAKNFYPSYAWPSHQKEE